MATGETVVAGERHPTTMGEQVADDHQIMADDTRTVVVAADDTRRIAVAASPPRSPNIGAASTSRGEAGTAAEGTSDYRTSSPLWLSEVNQCSSLMTA